MSRADSPRGSANLFEKLDYIFDTLNSADEFVLQIRDRISRLGALSPMAEGGSEKAIQESVSDTIEHRLEVLSSRMDNLKLRVSSITDSLGSLV